MTEREKMLRKQIARIISPKTSFEDFEGIMESQFHMDRRAVAYKKADAVIAALSHAPADGEAHAEIQRLRDAKRRALAIADERAKENVALRATLAASEGARQWHEIDSQTPRDRFIILWCREDDSYWWAKWQGGMWFGSDEHGLRRTSESFTPDYWRGIPIFAEPADTPDEGPDPLGYAKGERA